MNDKKVISAIVGRDEQMLSYVVERYSKLLWKTAASVLGNTSSAQEVEECIADTFIYLWQYPEKYDPDKAKLSSWLSMITRSRAIDRYRRMMKKKEISTEELVAESLGYTGLWGEWEESHYDNRRDRLLSCIRELDEKEKELLIRRYDYEQKANEIALAMNLSKKQVENRLYQVKKKLRKMMETDSQSSQNTGIRIGDGEKTDYMGSKHMGRER